MVEIRRQNAGKTPTKYGIVTKGLKPRYKKVLNENPVIKKYSDDDRFIQAIFRIEDEKIRLSHLQRPFVHPVSKEIYTFECIKDSYKIFNWECAYCKIPIQSRIDRFSPDNFTCEKCYKYYIKDSKKINQRIIESSLSFTEKCKRMMIDNQKSFLKYLKKNEK
jgi:hypothetical protein